MMVFAYTAIDTGGRKAAGTLPAPNRAAALEQIAQKGLTAVSVEEQHADRPPPERARAVLKRVSQTSVEAFSRELANLLAGGVPLSRALHILSREASQAAAREQWTAIHDDVVGGMSLAEAMSRWPRSFPAVHVAMVHAGEMGGFLDVVLGQIADFRSRERDLLSKVKGADLSRRPGRSRHRRPRLPPDLLHPPLLDDLRGVRRQPPGPHPGHRGRQPRRDPLRRAHSHRGRLRRRSGRAGTSSPRRGTAPSNGPSCGRRGSATSWPGSPSSGSAACSARSSAPASPSSPRSRWPATRSATRPSPTPSPFPSTRCGEGPRWPAAWPPARGSSRAPSPR